MLSPHEFATLLLIRDTPNPPGMEPEDLAALLEQQLVRRERLASGRDQWRVTGTGDRTLRAIRRFSRNAGA
ncbi:hypothetical protein ACT2FY_01190 [Paraburkholderia fungorum]|uniref:hypothetical protein n=1 Tax=Paraburkholderia fungorum TaxID=134537 RepID=UPI00402BBF9D